jgi:flotillin
MFGYRVPDPDQAMLISGGRQKSANGPHVKIVVGHGKWVAPVVRKVTFLSLSMQEAVVQERCVTNQGIELAVDAVVAFKVGDDDASIAAAAKRFQSDQQRMSALVGQIFSGHLRAIVGSMSVEEIIRERQRLSEETLAGSTQDVAKLGLVVDSLQIKGIDDLGSKYIDALSAPQRAMVEQAAKIAQAEAAQRASEAQQASERQQSQYARDTAVARAQYQSEIDGANQKAAQAGPLAQAQAQQAVLEEQAKVAARNAELREAELVAEVIKPAQAQAQAVRIAAEADAARVKLAAEAAASQNRIALEQAIIAQAPQVAEKVATVLQGSNLTVLNGAEGLTEAIATIAASGGVLVRGLMDGLMKPADPEEDSQRALEG